MTDLPKDEFERRPELVKKRARSILWSRIGISFLVFAVLISLGIQTANAISSFNTRGTIVSCTDHTGDCYQQGQSRTEEFLQELINSNHLGDLATRRVVVISSACSAKPQNIGKTSRIQKCVNEQLKKDREKR